MPSESIRLLFCDNESPHHREFDDHVVRKLKQEFPRYKVQVEHSQSLDFREGDFSPHLIKQGARSVRSFLSREDCQWDLVITDLDFASENEMGSRTAGFDIVETVYERSQQDFPWCEFLLFSAVAESMPPERYLKTARILKNNPESLIKLGRSVAGKSWKQMADRAVVLLRDALRTRALSLAGSSAAKVVQTDISRSTPSTNDLVPTSALEPPTTGVEYGRGLFKPEIYEIKLLKFSRFDQKLCLVVWSKAEPQKCFRKMTDGDEMYTLLALAANSSDFILLKDLCIKAKEQTGHPNVKGFTNDAVKQQVEKIRGWFEEEEDIVSLNAESPEAMKAGKMHKGDHGPRQICGYCVLFSRRGKGGYILGGTATTIEVPAEASVADVFNDPRAAIAKYEKAKAAAR